MPSLRRAGIDSFAHVPTFQQKINDLMIFTQVIESSQECCAGCINGGVLKGHMSLAQLAREFRVSLSFTLSYFPPIGFLRLGVAVKLKCGTDAKRQPSEALGSFLLQYRTLVFYHRMLSG